MFKIQLRNRVTSMVHSEIIASGPVSIGKLGQRPIFAVGAVILGAFLANFDSRLFSVALPDLRGAFSLSFDEGAWLSTVSTASQIFIAPAVAWLATVFGLRRVLGVPSLAYAAISLLIPVVRDYPSLIGLNILHGLLLGTFVPASLLIIFRNLPMKWWLVALAIYSMRVGFTLNSGISVVGYYVSQIGWQWLFWQDAFIAPMMALLVYLGTPNEPINRSLLSRADWGGMLLLGTGMAMIYSGLDQGNRLDWSESGTIVSLLSAGSLLTLVFFINESMVDRPWAHAEVILSRNIGLSLLVIVLYTLTALSGSSLAPNFLIAIAGLRPEQSGLVFLCFGVLPMALWVPVSIYLMQSYDFRWVLVVGLGAFAVAAILGTNLTHDWSRSDFVPMILLQSLGQSFCLLPLVIIALSNSDPTRATAFAAYVQVVRLGGAEIGLSLMGTWLRVREQVHSNFLGQHVIGGDANLVRVLQGLAERFSGANGSTAPARALGTLAALIQREANTLAYIDGFWLTFWLAIAALVCAAFIGETPPGPFKPMPAAGPDYVKTGETV
jgi:MFS transporter, DHA2 family, multidrug resistance protein